MRFICAYKHTRIPKAHKEKKTTEGTEEHLRRKEHRRIASAEHSRYNPGHCYPYHLSADTKKRKGNETKYLVW